MSSKRGQGLIRRSKGGRDLGDRCTHDEVPPPFNHGVHDFDLGDESMGVRQMVETSSSRAHGDQPSSLSPAPTHIDGRLLIQPVHDGFIPKGVTRQIMIILRKYMGPHATWELVPWDKKEYLFDKLKEKYTWLPHHDAGIRHSWEQTHKRNYKNTIHRIKKAAIQEVGSDDPRDLMRAVPKYMLSSDWETICNGWMNALNYQSKCIKARENRLTEKDGSIVKHTCCSISFAEHKRRMEQGGTRVSQVEVHDGTHWRKQGTSDYIDNKSKRVREEYDQSYSSQYGSNPTPKSSFDAQKWLEIGGGPCKNRVYDREVSVGTSSKFISMAPPVEYISQDQLQEAIAKALAEERQAAASREASLLEEVKKLTEDAKAREEATKAREEAMMAREEATKAREEAMMAREEALMATIASMMEKFNAIRSASASRDDRSGEGSQ